MKRIESLKQNTPNKFLSKHLLPSVKVKFQIITLQGYLLCIAVCRRLYRNVDKLLSKIDTSYCGKEHRLLDITPHFYGLIIDVCTLHVYAKSLAKFTVSHR